jgi:hypothetical protein
MFLASLRKRRSSSTWWTIEAIRATACRRVRSVSSADRMLRA